MRLDLRLRSDRPYRELHAYDMVVQAMSGVMSITGPEGGPPVRVACPSATWRPACSAPSASSRRCSNARAPASGGTWTWPCSTARWRCSKTRWRGCRSTARRRGRSARGIRRSRPLRCLPGGEGALVIAAGNDAMFERLCQALGRPELPTDARFARNGQRSRHHDALRIELEQALRAQRPPTGCACCARPASPAAPGQRRGCAARRSAGARAPHAGRPAAARRGALTVAGCPVKFDAEPPSRFRAAPQLDQHRGALLAELGLTPG